MSLRNHSKNHLKILIKYVVLLCIFAILGSTAACSLPFKIVPNNQEGGPPPGEEPWEGDHPPEEPWEDEHPPEEPWEDEHPPEEPWEDEHPPEEPPPGEHPPEEPPPGEPPPEPPPAQPAQPAPPAQSSGGGGGAFTADVSVTDIYAGNKPQGQFHVRITNHGPGTLNNVKVPVTCQYERTDKNTKAQSAKSANISVKLSMKPGEQMSFPTTLDLDTNVFEYLVACEVKPNFNDPDMGNNNYNEPIY
jgi:hypothetical protein